MKRIFTTAAGIMMMIHALSQTNPSDSGYVSRKLKLEEINLVSSYYNQDGNHAAVTGGIGSQKLTDISNNLDVKFIRYDSKARKQNLDLELGIDHYTSASSDKIDLKANSSASHGDIRIYPSLTWSVENQKTGWTIASGISSSTEFDYQSFGGNISAAKKTKNKMAEFTLKIQAYLDQVKQVLPVELRTGGGGEGDDHNYSSKPRNSFSGSLSYSQIINKNLQVLFIADVVQQQGFLSLPFNRVYFTDGSVHQEKLPNSRLKIPLGVRVSYYIGEKFIVRAWYRYYTDDWKLKAHTAELELPIKLTPFVSISPFYRFYQQSAIQYFDVNQGHTAADQYYSSNYDFSKFNSHFVGVGVHITPAKGVFGIEHFNTLELRYGHYSRTNNLNANIVSLLIKYK